MFFFRNLRFFKNGAKIAFFWHITDTFNIKKVKNTISGNGIFH